VQPATSYYVSKNSRFTGWLQGVIGKNQRQHFQRPYCSLNVGSFLNMSLSSPVSILLRWLYQDE